MPTLRSSSSVVSGDSSQPSKLESLRSDVSTTEQAYREANSRVNSACGALESMRPGAYGTLPTVTNADIYRQNARYHAEQAKEYSRIESSAGGYPNADIHTGTMSPVSQHRQLAAEQEKLARQEDAKQASLLRERQATKEEMITERETAFTARERARAALRDEQSNQTNSTEKPSLWRRVHRKPGSTGLSSSRGH